MTGFAALRIGFSKRSPFFFGHAGHPRNGVQRMTIRAGCSIRIARRHSAAVARHCVIAWRVAAHAFFLDGDFFRFV